jgi:glycosyltransferase involved in cell wall biosynthesis
VVDYWNSKRLRTFSNQQEHDFRGLSLVFLVGSLSISGGTNIILGHAEYLAKRGARVTIAHMLGDAADASWHPFGDHFRTVSLSEVEGEYFDLAIATWWPTSYELHRVRFSRALYFVQGLESKFAMSEDGLDKKGSALAALSLCAGLPMVTVASWLQNLIAANVGTQVWLALNGVDKSKFKIPETVPEHGSKKLRVLVEGGLGTPLKALRETIEAIYLADLPNIELWHMNPNPRLKSKKVDRVFDKVPFDEVPQLLGQVDVLVKMSRMEGMFGPPLEAFHSGATAIVSRVVGYDEYIQPGKNAIAVEVDDFDSMVSAVRRLSEHPEELRGLREGALDTARNWPGLDRSSRTFAAICYAVMSSPLTPHPALQKLDQARVDVEKLVATGADPRELAPRELW